MGVPKFFRYISERYPCLSEIVREYQIPEFDNMYLDMNGIIHMCSHPDDNNPHFRITEEKIFQDIFHYLEVLFRMIKPRKLFFMAIDGVAPRAKMNQQRGRRFRSAKDALKQEEDAKKKGEELPKESRFDSNCITPGTLFMAKLHEQLKYFVVEKISNDPLWRQCKIILSGHETPGEGEHKIMDYIRYLRSQPGYDPNTRHCLYGLDADLIMLGLCSHEPHFSLLREEVKFGKKSTKRESVPEEITFFLLHLSLMREYLELEFAPVRQKLTTFEYDLEKIIDDWVLMGFLVGNDFIPHLPNLHIANGALPILYKAYMDVLPTLDGYINESGNLSLQRFEKFMQKLSSIDLENFEEIRDDMMYMEAKTGRKCIPGRDYRNGNSETNLIEFEFDDEPKPTDSGLEALIKNTEDMYLNSSGEDEDEDEEEDRAFEDYKKEYYRNKLEYTKVTPEVMRAQAEGYVRAIQWNLHYYYNGLCSWSWYYPHHYSPYISDIKGFQDLNLDFDLGTPFLPYEQLLGVLPSASKTLLPEAYHGLMLSEESPLKKYYPENFDTDLNGKRQDWEAVVLIPFIDENLLLDAMRPCNEKLLPEEKERNKHGPMLVYTYTDKDLGQYVAPAYFPAVRRNHADLQTLSMEDVRVPKEKLVKGAYPGVKMDVYYPGFPTMKHLQYEAGLMKAKVKVFEQPSRSESMIIKIISEEKEEDDVPTEWLGTTVFIGWPHLVEARVQAISNNKKKWLNMGGPHHYNIEDRKENQLPFKDEAAGVIERYRTRMGIEVGEVKALVHVQVMTGRKYIFAPNGRLTLEKQFSELTANYPVQTVVANINSYDSYHTTFRDVSEVFPEGSTCFTLSNPYYGSQGIVLNSKETLSKNGRLKVCISVPDEPDFTLAKNLQAEIIRSYKTLYHVAGALGMSNNLFSRITGSIFVMTRNRDGEMKSVNIGLDLKFNKKNKETPGFTRKIGNTWYYTDKVADMVNDYTTKFPEVFEFLCRHDSFDNIMGDDIFGDDSDEKVKEVQKWLKSLPSHSVEKQICGSQAAEPEVVNEIENIMDKFLGSKIASKKVTMQIKPSLLYKPEIQSGTLVPDPKMTVQLFDRIVNTRIGYSVPFAFKGTVTAICQSPTGSDRDTMYEVVFDKPFKDGMALNCTSGRGYKLPKTSFINVTYGKRLVDEKTGGPTGNFMTSIDNGGKPQLDSKPLDPVWRRNYNNQYSANKPLDKAEYNDLQRNRSYKGNFNQPNSAFAQFPNAASQVPASNPAWNIPDVLRKEPKDRQKHTPRNESNKTNFMPNFSKKEEKENEGGLSTPRNEINKSKENDRRSDIAAERLEASTNVQSLPKNDESAKQNANRKGQSVQSSDNVRLNLLSRNNNGDPEQKNDIRENYRNIKVDTDFLKNLIKTGENSNQKTTEKVQVKSPNPSSEMSSIVSFEDLARVAKAPASVRLLTYYQSNGLGVPRYQYMDLGESYKAQIALTDGNIVWGKPGKTKEEATENVASQVLGMLISKADSVFMKPPSPIFPAPPKTWVDSKTVNKSEVKDPKKSPKASTDHPFVPLQAVKSLRKVSGGAQSKGGANGVNSSENEQKKDEKSEIHKEGNTTTNNNSVSNKNKPRGQRKPRIAANFVNKR